MLGADFMRLDPTGHGNPAAQGNPDAQKQSAVYIEALTPRDDPMPREVLSPTTQSRGRLENGTSIRPIRSKYLVGVPGIISHSNLLNLHCFYDQIKGHSGGREGFMGGHWTRGQEEGLWVEGVWVGGEGRGE